MLTKTASDPLAVPDRLINECGEFPAVEWRVRHARTSETIVCPLRHPITRVGRGAGCDLRLMSEDVAEVQALLIRAAGQVFLIDVPAAQTGQRDAVTTVAPGQRVSWGAWQATASRFATPPQNDAAALHELVLALQWTEPRRTALLPADVVTLVGTSPACRLRLDSPRARRVHAVLLRLHTSCWIVNLADAAETRINGHPVGVAALEPGDVVSFADRDAEFIVRWPDPARDPRPVAAEAPPPVAPTPPSDWQAFLIEQSARLTQMQQRLDRLQQGSTASALPDDLQPTVEQLRELAADCERRAAEWVRSAGLPTRPR